MFAGSEDKVIIEKLLLLLNKVEEMKNQRQMLEAQVRKQIMEDDVTKLLATRTDDVNLEVCNFIFGDNSPILAIGYHNALEINRCAQFYRYRSNNLTPAAFCIFINKTAFHISSPFYRRPHTSWLRQVESYLEDTGMAGLASAWVMARRRPI